MIFEKTQHGANWAGQVKRSGEKIQPKGIDMNEIELQRKVDTRKFS